MSVQGGLRSAPGGPGGTWGRRGTAGVSSGVSTPSYSSITAINTSVRNDKNVLEIRLEKQQGASFNMTQLETEALLARLAIDGSHFEGVTACPEGKPVVFVTMHPTVNIKKFLYRNESYMVKEGVRTTTIRPAGKKDVLVTVSGLHPNTKDQAVIRYLSAHGKVSQTDKVVYHVFPGAAGSSLCAGKFNGNRSYVMEIKEHLGSYHIIDGEKVSIRYPGQEWSCARCHQFKHSCPGSAVARDCTADRVMLSTFMIQHWNKIGYKPESEAVDGVDDEPELEIQVGQHKLDLTLFSDSKLTSKYRSIIVKGFNPELSVEAVIEELVKSGLPNDYKADEISRNDKTGNLTIPNLEPQQCLNMMDAMHGKKFLGRKVYVTLVVANSPTKAPVAESVPVKDSTPASTKSSEVAPPNLVISKAVSETNLKTPLLTDTETSLTNLPTPRPKSSSSSQPSFHAENAGNCSALSRSSSSLSNLDGFEFDAVDFNAIDDKKKFFEDMFPLPVKRKAIESPESKDLSKKDKKLIKTQARNKSKSDQKSKAQLEVSPSKL